jgi:hypothetical protein
MKALLAAGDPQCQTSFARLATLNALASAARSRAGTE